jgi:hypothetical protein
LFPKLLICTLQDYLGIKPVVSNVAGSQKLATTGRGMTRCAGVAWQKGHSRQGHGKDNVVLGTQKGRMFGKRRQLKPEGISEIRI